jgi:dCTP deaminase
MAVLTHDIILEYIAQKIILIDPFDAASVGPASVDLHLDDRYRVFQKRSKPFDLNDLATHNDITEEIPPADEYTIMPGQTIHGITIEKITLPGNICGWLEGRSSLGRIGLAIHITAGFIHPGISNKQVLEINNMSPVPLVLHKGIAVCQIIFEETKGEAKYQGKYSSQVAP